MCGCQLLESEHLRAQASKVSECIFDFVSKNVAGWQKFLRTDYHRGKMRVFKGRQETSQRLGVCKSPYCEPGSGSGDIQRSHCVPHSCAGSCSVTGLVSSSLVQLMQCSTLNTIAPGHDGGAAPSVSESFV